MTQIRHWLLLLFFVWNTALVGAQDLHFSQFYLNPTHLSPALTGVFRGDWRAAAIYRSQWKSVPVPWQTFSGTMDWKTIRRNADMLSLGFQVQHDRTGDAALTWTQVGAMASVAHALGENHALSAGIGLAFVQRRFDISALRFKNQWSGDLFDLSLPTGEQFDQNSGLATTLSAGLNWHFEASETRTRVDVSAGAFHLNRPRIQFGDDAEQGLPRRMALALDGALQTGEYTDVVIFGAAQQMGKAREIVAGAGVRRVLNNDAAIRFSLATRLGDALIPAFQLEWQNWTAGLSYDLNTSGFDVATNRRGGMEIAVIYRPMPVEPVKTFKSCPIF